MFRIMLVASKRDNYDSLYKYLTVTRSIAGGTKVTYPLELVDEAALDIQVEKMLNEEGYSKSDFIVVKCIDYTIDAKDYTNTRDDDEASSSENEEAGGDGENTP